ncbi:MAG TPA: hypothetical protein DC057_19375 [Spirochaetia bacterium]|nr:hypothetical protein [Spirochaetia bacterium]
MVNTGNLGIRGIISDFSLRKLFLNWYILVSLIISIIYVVISYKTDNLYNNLKDIVDLSIQIFPNLLGFVLGGYILIIGFGNTDFIKKASVTLVDKNTTYFERINSIFAFSIIIHSLTLLFSVLLFLIYRIGAKTNLADTFNCFFLFLTVFLIIYSIFIIYLMVINVFNFAKVYFVYLSTQKK